MNNNYKPLWTVAALTIPIIFGFIYLTANIISPVLHLSSFSYRTFAGVILGLSYITVFSRFIEKRCRDYFENGGINVYQDDGKGKRKDKYSDIMKKTPDTELDNSGKAIKKDLAFLSKCFNVYTAILAISYISTFSIK
ncbi:MAG: hypothetical protein Q8878_05880 [Bacillota bacterium]|nr:hypothetical protein [Bacillota bacterium]